MRNDLTMKELKLHTLTGDIQECGMAGMSKRQIRGMLEPRFVTPESGITAGEFADALEREYAKAMARRASK